MTLPMRSWLNRARRSNKHSRRPPYSHYQRAPNPDIDWRQWDVPSTTNDLDFVGAQRVIIFHTVIKGFGLRHVIESDESEKTSAHSHQERLHFLYSRNSDRPQIGPPQRSRPPFGGELQSHWHRLSRQSQPQHKLAAWWCERVQPRLIFTVFLPPYLMWECGRTGQRLCDGHHGLAFPAAICWIDFAQIWVAIGVAEAAVSENY